MMKRSFLLSILGLFVFVLFAQNTIIPNNSFESWWQDTSYVINDVGDAWLDDTVCARSTDAAQGDFALYLKTSGQNAGRGNVAYVVFGKTDDFPNFKGVPYLGTATPDSLLLSYKANMQNQDSAEVWLFFYKEGIMQSQEKFKFGTAEAYTDTAIAISDAVTLPDSVFLAYASGDAMGEGDTDGNEVWFDKVFVKEESGNMVMLPHGVFETWDTLLSLEMDELTNASSSVFITEDAFAGDYAIGLRSNYHDENKSDPYFDNFRLWGELQYVNDQTMMNGGIPLVGERNMLTFYYKYNLADEQKPDTAEAIIYLYDSDNGQMITNSVYLPPTDTFTAAHLWYSPFLRAWNGTPDSIAVEFRASKYREQLPAYTLEGNTLIIDSLFFQSEAIGEMTIYTPDTSIDNNSNVFVSYDNTSGSGMTEFYVIQDTLNILSVDYGQEGGNKLYLEASPFDTFFVYARDYYNAEIIDSFQVFVKGQDPEEGPVVLQEMPDPDFENWQIYAFDYPTGMQTRNTDDADTAWCVEKVASPGATGFAAKLINAGRNSMGNNLSYLVIGSSGDDGMAPTTYAGTTPNKIAFSYATSMQDDAMVWVQFYKMGQMISSDTILLPTQTSYGASSFDLNLSENDPDSVFIAIASGYVWSEGGNDGDSLVIDNIRFLNGESEVGVPLNGDFETWESLDLHQSEAMCEQEGYIRRVEDAASGDYAMFMKTVRNDDSKSYPYYNAVLLWGDNEANKGLVADKYRDQLVFSYKYILLDNNTPDTANAAVVLYDQSHERYFGIDLLPTGNEYQEARISIDTTNQDFDFEPTMMRLEFSPSKYRENYDPNYAYEGNGLYIDDLYWHSDALSEVDILTPDTVITAGNNFKIRFEVTGSRSDSYVFMGASTDSEEMWYMNQLMNSGEDYIWLEGNYPEGDKFMVYMIDYFNPDIQDSVKVTVDVASINKQNESGGLHLYPLPIHSTLHIEHSSDILDVELYDISGTLKCAWSPCAKALSFDFSPYSKGLYLLRVRTQEGVQNRVVVK